MMMPSLGVADSIDCRPKDEICLLDAMYEYSKNIKNRQARFRNQLFAASTYYKLGQIKKSHQVINKLSGVISEKFQDIIQAYTYLSILVKKIDVGMSRIEDFPINRFDEFLSSGRNNNFYQYIYGELLRSGHFDYVEKKLKEIPEGYRDNIVEIMVSQLTDKSLPNIASNKLKTIDSRCRLERIKSKLAVLFAKRNDQENLSILINELVECEKSEEILFSIKEIAKFDKITSRDLYDNNINIFSIKENDFIFRYINIISSKSYLYSIWNLKYDEMIIQAVNRISKSKLPEGLRESDSEGFRDQMLLDFFESMQGIKFNGSILDLFFSKLRTDYAKFVFLTLRLVDKPNKSAHSKSISSVKSMRKKIRSKLKKISDPPMNAWLFSAIVKTSGIFGINRMWQTAIDEIAILQNGTFRAVAISQFLRGWRVSNKLSLENDTK